MGDRARAKTNAVSAATGNAAGGRPDFRRDNLYGPDPVAHPRGDRCQRLSTALRSFAGIANDLDDMFAQRDSGPPGRSGLARAEARLHGGFGHHFVHLATLGNANARIVALPQIDSEESPEAVFADIVDAEITDSQIVFHAARGLTTRAHRFDHGRGAGDDIAAGK